MGVGVNKILFDGIYLKFWKRWFALVSKTKKKKRAKYFSPPCPFSLPLSPIDSKSGGVFAFCIEQAIKRRERQRERCGCFLWLMFLICLYIGSLKSTKKTIIHFTLVSFCILLNNTKKAKQYSKAIGWWRMVVAFASHSWAMPKTVSFAA